MHSHSHNGKPSSCMSLIKRFWMLSIFHLGRIGLDWFVLSWIGLDLVELVSTWLNWFVFGRIFFWLNAAETKFCESSHVFNFHRQPIINEELSWNKTKSEQSSNETRVISKLKVKSITDWKQLQVYLQLSWLDFRSQIGF